MTPLFLGVRRRLQVPLECSKPKKCFKSGNFEASPSWKAYFFDPNRTRKALDLESPFPHRSDFIVLFFCLRRLELTSGLDKHGKGVHGCDLFKGILFCGFKTGTKGTPPCWGSPGEEKKRVGLTNTRNQVSSKTRGLWVLWPHRS